MYSTYKVNNDSNKLKKIIEDLFNEYFTKKEFATSDTYISFNFRESFIKNNIFSIKFSIFLEKEMLNHDFKKFYLTVKKFHENFLIINLEKLKIDYLLENETFKRQSIFFNINDIKKCHSFSKLKIYTILNTL